MLAVLLAPVLGEIAKLSRPAALVETAHTCGIYIFDNDSHFAMLNLQLPVRPQ